MSAIKKLAGQTLWYGASSIVARFLNYLLTPYLTKVLPGANYGEMSLVYALIPLINVVFTYGLETAYFRFARDKERKDEVFNTSMISLLTSTIIFTAILLFFNDQLAAIIGLKDHPEYLTWSAFTIAFDALTALAFAKLRLEERPVKFAAVRIAGIVVNIAATVFFLSVCPYFIKNDPDGFTSVWYNPRLGVGYVIMAMLIQSAFTLLLLSREVFSFKWKFNKDLWKEIMIYALPLILVGFAGNINEVFDRIMLNWWAPGSARQAKIEVGTYSSVYKLSLLITLSVQAFRMAAEPFFFTLAKGQDPQKTYARVMKFFVITICFMFLSVALFLDVWKYFIQNKVFWAGLGVVPILLLANMFLGIYYNLSIWYKLKNRTMSAAWITIVGSAITLTINYFFIPRYSYVASAWATFFCYGVMMVLSYIMGQKVYPVPYAWKKLCGYMVICVIMFLVQWLLRTIGLGVTAGYAIGVLELGIFFLIIARFERHELARFPYVGRFFRTQA